MLGTGEGEGGGVSRGDTRGIESRQVHSTERTPSVIVIGAGPAGLAVSACLTQRGIRPLLLERAEHVGNAWRNHYSRLHLHTHRRHSGLPLFPMPADFPRYPARDQVVGYLASYARHFGLLPKFGEWVVRLRAGASGWEVQTTNALHRAPHVVVATGYAREPIVPDWPGRAAFAGRVLHSSAYRNGAAFRGQRVLVVGFGNSGGEIAIDLTEQGATASLAVRGEVNVIPREILGVPILSIGIAQRLFPPAVADALSAPVLRAIFGDLASYGLRKAPYGPQVQIRRHKRIPLIDIGTMGLIREGRIAVRPGVASFTREGVTFADGREEPFDAVILATGYRPRVNEFLEGTDGALDASGAPLAGDEALRIPGLHFCGFNVSANGMFRAISKEAPRIAATIAAGIA